MTLRVATVLSAREWESRLVALARSTASVRLAVRAFRPEDLSERVGELDAIVVGAETPWATPTRIAAWARSGARIVGVHAVGDRPAIDRLKAAGVDLLLDEDLPAEAMLREIRLLEPVTGTVDALGPLVAVTGPRGAPGRTEVALGLAWCMAGDGPVALIDADRHAPALAVRLGIPPRPDVADAVDHIFSNGVESTPDTHRLGRLRVLPGAHRPGEPALRSETVFDVVEALRGEAAVVVDLGPFPEGGETLKASTEAWMVIDASPIGVVRAATALAEWAGPPPRIALNRVRARSGDDTLRAVRRWTGLEPAAVIGFSTAIANAASGGQSPARTLLAPLSRACR